MHINKNLSLLLIAVFICAFSKNVFTGESHINTFIGKKICREAQGPDDTTSFNIILQDGGKIDGSGSFSGATANFLLSSGTWRLQGDRIEISLFFAGEKYGENKTSKGEKNIQIKILKSELEKSISDCYEFTDPL